MYGYQLKTEFERSTNHVWPLNIGQVYTTLNRLVRDGLVEQTEDEPEGSHQSYRITELGRSETLAWYSRPVSRATPPRDELTAKIMIALNSDRDVREIIQVQRSAAVHALQEFTRLKARSSGENDLTWLMMLDSFIVGMEAEIRWLDLVEARIASHAAVNPSRSNGGPPESAGVSGPSAERERELAKNHDRGRAR